MESCSGLFFVTATQNMQSAPNMISISALPQNCPGTERNVVEPFLVGWGWEAATLIRTQHYYT